MENTLSKILSIVLYILMGIGAVLGILFYAGAVTESALIYYCYFLLAIAAVVAIIFPIFGIVTNPKGARGALIGIGVLALIIIISYAVAGDEMLPKYEGFINSSSESKWVSAGLISLYILGGLAILATIFSSINRVIK